MDNVKSIEQWLHTSQLYIQNHQKNESNQID